MKLLTTALAAMLCSFSNNKVMAQIPMVKHIATPVTPADTLQQMLPTNGSDFEVSEDPQNGRLVYKGIFTYEDMVKEPTFSWLAKGIDEYHPDKDALLSLKKHLTYYKILVFLGTWCGDSHDMIPKLYKTLDGLNITYDNLMLVGMDRKKKTKTHTAKKLAKKYDISHLPTIVLIDENGNAAGRINETVSRSVEHDLSEIINKNR